MNNIKEIFFNRADIEKNEHICCDKCFEPIIFFLTDKTNREFSIGLSTVLECLEAAVKTGDLPKLPSSWVSDVENAFHIEFDENVSYYDEETFEKRGLIK